MIGTYPAKVPYRAGKVPTKFSVHAGCGSGPFFDGSVNFLLNPVLNPNPTVVLVKLYEQVKRNVKKFNFTIFFTNFQVKISQQKYMKKSK